MNYSKNDKDAYYKLITQAFMNQRVQSTDYVFISNALLAGIDLTPHQFKVLDGLGGAKAAPEKVTRRQNKFAI
jgi:hypothetical protein